MDVCANAQEPITTDLRGKMDTLGWYDEDGNIVYTTGGKPASEIACLVINSKTFGELCDAIDAVQANLERENETLRGERLNELMDARDKCVRGLLDDPECFGLMELPRDADGKPIHVGDVIVTINGYEDVVEGILPDRVLVLRDGEWFTVRADWCYRHVHDTWERIIEDAKGRYSDADTAALVARCRALAGEAE